MSSDRLAVALRRLSSGLRINSAADDAAGLSISERMRGQIRGLEQANRNVQDGLSLLAVMDGALSEVHSILQRARELAVQFNNGTNSFADRQTIAQELIGLSNEVARIEGATSYNGIALLQSASATLTLQVGANDAETMLVSLVDLFGPGLSLVRPGTFFTLPWLKANIPFMDAHIDDVASARGRIGAMSNRLEHTLAANQVVQENLMQAESHIRDVDMASEMTALVRQQLLQQSGIAMLKLAGGSPNRVSNLLYG